MLQQLLPLLITIVMDAAIVLLIYRKRRFRQQASQSAGRSEEYTVSVTLCFNHPYTIIIIYR